MVQLYRQMLKSARNIKNKPLSLDLRGQITREFHRNKALTEGMTIRNLVQEATRNARQLKDLAEEPSDNATNGDTWINTGDETDKRGRVGTGWPWSKK